MRLKLNSLKHSVISHLLLARLDSAIESFADTSLIKQVILKYLREV